MSQAYNCVSNLNRVCFTTQFHYFNTPYSNAPYLDTHDLKYFKNPILNIPYFEASSEVCATPRSEQSFSSKSCLLLCAKIENQHAVNFIQDVLLHLIKIAATLSSCEIIFVSFDESKTHAAG